MRRRIHLPVVPPATGRGTNANLPNRFERLHVAPDPEEAAEEAAGRETIVYRDPSRSVLTRNNSPDIGFEWSVNPYRGCEHGCTYCYARPTHEYLGFSAGLDFESRIVAKTDAPLLLARRLRSPRWKPTTIVMSGVTDPYQPVERRLGITRGCLEVFAAARHPVAVITKSDRILRDLDLLASLAEVGAAGVSISITTLERRLQRAMEPRAATPERRLEAIRRLSEAGVPVGVNVAPIVPGLTDHELPEILEAARAAGARFAGRILLRLPHGVKELFLAWLERAVPERAAKVQARIRETRGGELYDSTWGSRMSGEGLHAELLQRVFRVHAERLGFERRPPGLSAEHFRREAVPDRDDPQLGLFG
jgi:DNA repair photolyase